MSERIIHVSDLHYAHGKPESCGKILNALVNDLQTNCDTNDGVVFIFSGDAVLSGDDNESFDEVASKLADVLDRVGIPRNKRVFVPGNHDVSRESIRPALFMHDNAVDSIKSEDQFHSKSIEIEKRLLVDKFTNYIKFESLVSDLKCCESNVFGNGWEISDQLGIYALNSAACSSAGLIEEDKSRTDYGRLHAYTRGLYDWVAKSKSKYKILISHHPLEWFSEWASKELRSICQESFDLLLTGHLHDSSSNLASSVMGKYVHLSSPAIFTNKHDFLGYSIIDIDTDCKKLTVKYRATNGYTKFVAGTLLSGTENGVVEVGQLGHLENGLPQAEPHKPIDESGSVSAFEQELDNILYLSKSEKNPWVDREFSLRSEAHGDNNQAELLTIDNIVENNKYSVIRGSTQSGLTSVAANYCYRVARDKKDKLAILLDASVPKGNPNARNEYISSRLDTFGLDADQIGVVFVDNWSEDRACRKFVEHLVSSYANASIIILQNTEEWLNLQAVGDSIFGQGNDAYVYYLRSLSRSLVRNLVRAEIGDAIASEVDSLANAILSSLDGINAHRSPLNCLLMLRLLEKDDDDAPINRYELIDKALSMLFYEFDEIPSYADRPDLKDCVFALGYFSEYLFKNQISKFNKRDFSKHIQNVCDKRLLQIDVSLLFQILMDSKIIIYTDGSFKFRCRYWHMYFVAHRMHHSSEFASYVFDEQRYASCPEIIEYYTAIDRQRTDAIRVLTDGLRQLNVEFQNTTRIPIEFDPYVNALWNPGVDTVKQMRESLSNGLASSSLPQSVKDALADQNYSPAKPYRQDVSAFIDESTINKVLSAAQAASRALRNSDFVEPEYKMALLDEVFKSWLRMCQVIAIISPLMAKTAKASFQDARFEYVSFDKNEPEEKRWLNIMDSILANVISYFHEDLHSKKLGPLVARYAEISDNPITKALSVLLLIRHRPKGWDDEVDRQIVKLDKNSVYLSHIMRAALHEVRLGVASEKHRSKLMTFASKSIAKHETGSKDPGTKLVERVRKQLDKDVE